MQPTPKLRWINSEEINLETQCVDKVRILQQWWDGLPTGIALNYANPKTRKFAESIGEWRDVPVEKEE